MSNFVELTQNSKHGAEDFVLLNRYHVSTITKSHYTGKTLVRMNNGFYFEVEESYEDVKEVMTGDFDGCK